MSRGVMYHIGHETEIGNYVPIDESEFYEEISALGVDYVQNQHPENAKVSVSNLVQRLWAVGFKVKLTTDPDLEGFYLFQTGSEAELTACKAAYFKSAFESMKQMVNTMSLETFASDGGEEYMLRSLINNKMGDAVYYGAYLEEVYSLDSFIRKLTPNTGYYIAPETIYMH